MKKLLVVLVISVIFVFGLSGLSSAESWCKGPSEGGVIVCKYVEPNMIDICEMPEEIQVKLEVNWRPPELERVPIDVVFAIDSSGSMGGEEGNDPGVTDRTDAVNAFIERLDRAQDRAVIVSWDDTVDFTCPCKDEDWKSCKPPKYATLTNGFEAVKACMKEIVDEGYTDFDVALNVSIKLLDDNPPRELRTNRIIVFLTDGETDVYNHSRAVEAADKGYTIYSIGLGEGISPSAKRKLLDMNTTTGGIYKYAPTSEGLVEIFEDIFKKVSASPIISKIDVTDVLHNYLKVEDSFTIYPNVGPTSNPDGTTTMKWQVTNLSEGHWETSFNVNFELSLPVDVVDGSKTPKETSEVRYVYKGKTKDIPIPEGELLIVCSPEQTQSPSPVTPTPSPKIPGFEAIFAIAGLLAVAYLVWRRKK